MTAIKREQWLMAALFVSLVITLAFAAIPRSHGQECISVVAETSSDNGSVQLQISNAEGCISIYGLYVQVERNGSIQKITHTPSGWTYGEVEKIAASWTTDTDPIDSNSKTFGIEIRAAKPYTLVWITVDETWSPLAKGTLTIG